VKEPFEAFVDKLIDRVQEEDPSVMMTAKEAIFRINRDIRFSKDKTPYKTQMSAIISAGGKKNKSYPGLYVEVKPSGVGYYGGAYVLEKEEIHRVRTAIAQDPEGFAELLAQPDFADTFGTLQGDKHKRLPAEFKEVGEIQPLIFNKSFYYNADIPASHILNDDLVDVIMEHFRKARPVQEWLIEALYP
ncbi:MAG: DUF2461 domain-containing protein, partial [Bacteroidota bacterium]